MRTVSLPRRVVSVLVGGAVLIAIACLTLSFREDSSWTTTRWPIHFTTDDGESYSRVRPDGGRVKIALIETIGTHDEVAAALMHSFGGMPNAEMGVFFRTQRYHMDDIMAKFDLETPIAVTTQASNFGAVSHSEWTPDIIVSTTCEFDARNHADPWLKLLDKTDAHLFCIIHHADQWTKNKHVETVKRFHEKDRLEIVGLSAHTVEYFLNHSAPHWDGGKTVVTRVLPPVFPVDVPAPDPKAPVSLAMQGDYSSDRRDYKAIFGSLTQAISAVKEYGAYSTDDHEETVDLHVIGHGKKPAVPDEVKDRVFFDESLSYPDFYATLSPAYGVLPAFASDQYYDRKASSTVPASLIAGAPLVADERLLKAYSYIPREAVWLRNEGETEMDAVKRVITERDELAKRREAVKQTRLSLMKQNRQNVKEWISAALKRKTWAEGAGAATTETERKAE